MIIIVRDNFWFSRNNYKKKPRRRFLPCTRLERPSLPRGSLVTRRSPLSFSMFRACHCKPDRDWACNVSRKHKFAKVSLSPPLFLFISTDVLLHSTRQFVCIILFIIYWKPSRNLIIITHKLVYSPQSYEIFSALRFLITYLLLNNNCTYWLSLW